MRPVILRRLMLQGDALHHLRSLPDQSVDSVVTSPPYFRLRDYQVPWQLGLENTIEQWVDHLEEICQEIARVLVPTGTFWLNLGDTYSLHPGQGAPRKSLLAGPERLLLRLLGGGWTIRNKVVWAKTSTTPTSVRDRLATKHEVVYLLTRGPSYFFDLDAIREPHKSAPTRARSSATKPTRRAAWLGSNADDDAGLLQMRQRGIQGHPLGKNPGDVWPIAPSRGHGAHIAAFPEALAERAILAGCPERRCSKCRLPYERPLRRSGDFGQHAQRLPLTPTCDCLAPSEPGLVLDPFLGSGTTAVVVERLGRDWLGIELAPESVALAKRRLHDERGREAA